MATAPEPPVVVALRTPLMCWHESLYAARTDRLLSLGEQGAELATDAPIPLGAALYLEFPMGQKPDAPLAQVDAVVTRLIAGVGVELSFVAVPPDAHAFVRTRVQTGGEAPPLATASLAADEAAAAGAAVMPIEFVELPPGFWQLDDEPGRPPPMDAGAAIPEDRDADFPVAAPDAARAVPGEVVSSDIEFDFLGPRLASAAAPLLGNASREPRSVFDEITAQPTPQMARRTPTALPPDEGHPEEPHDDRKSPIDRDAICGAPLDARFLLED